MALIKNKPHAQFLPSSTGSATFSTGTVAERLAFSLGNGLARPVADERQQAVAKGRQQIDQRPEFTRIRTIAEAAIADGETMAAKVDQQKRDFRPERFTDWIQGAEDEYLAGLLEKTARVREQLDVVLAAYPKPGFEPPTTNVELAQLQLRLTVLAGASFADADTMITGAIKRGDRAFLVAAASQLRGRDNDAQSADEIVRNGNGPSLSDLLDRIASARGVDEEIAAYALEQCAAYESSWRYLARTLTQDYRLDKMQRQTGALSPILEPVA